MAWNALARMENRKGEHLAQQLVHGSNREPYDLQAVLHAEVDGKQELTVLHLATKTGERSTCTSLNTASGGVVMCPYKKCELWCQVDKDTVNITAKDSTQPCTLVDDEAETTCPGRGCYRYLKIVRETTQSKKTSEQDRTRRSIKDKPARYAFVTVLWGSSDKACGLVMDGLVLGDALRRYTTTTEAIDRVLLITSDLAANPLSHLLSQYWIVKVIEEVKVRSPLVSKCLQRFRRTFNKLRVMELTDYDKICLMDSDMLPRGNIEEVFYAEPPAAVMRGHRETLPGEVRKHASYFNKKGFQQFGINAGLVVLRPDHTEFQGTLELLEDDHFANHSQVASRNRGVYTNPGWLSKS